MVKNLPANAAHIRDSGLIPGSGRPPGGGHSNPLQYSCLENPMDGGAWWATVQRVTKSQTRLKQLSTHSHIHGDTTLRASHVAQTIKNLPAMQETQVPTLGQEAPMEKGMVTHSSILDGEFHGQRSLACYRPWVCKESDTGEQLTQHKDTGKLPYVSDLTTLYCASPHWEGRPHPFS